MALARVEGFEPPTPGLEGLCSIQLSYTRQDEDVRDASIKPARASHKDYPFTAQASRQDARPKGNLLF